MKKVLFFFDYWEKIEGYMQEISNLAHRTGDVKSEMLSALESLQSGIGGKILLLFMEVSLLFLCRLAAILLSRADVCENERYNRERMFKIDNYIRTNFTGKINVKALADLIGMSRGHFFRYFKSVNSCSFNEYLTQKRLDEAVKMLRDKDMKIVEISDRCGFSSHIQFNRAFRKMMKMTPSEYRSVEN